MWVMLLKQNRTDAMFYHWLMSVFAKTFRVDAVIEMFADFSNLWIDGWMDGFVEAVSRD